MAPRGRQRKSGTSRMDAAIDAMRPYGFSKELVRCKMKEVLKEYGGNEGYPFIEADCYKVLIETILGEQEERSEGETSGKDNLLSEDERAGNHASASTAGSSGALRTDDGPGNGCPLPAEGDGRGGEDIGLDKACSQMERTTNPDGDNDVPVCSPPPMIASPPVLQGIPIQKPRRSCHGWISDDDEEDAFSLLPPSSAPAQAESSTDGKNKQKKRKTRWDLRPQDMQFSLPCVCSCAFVTHGFWFW